ncbi:DUF6461 domain-containing protein [Microtetraspora malaysiensis]|uniref:DUF6461 domain-containing protein n=1 Tax=Microtetraspora malaysiensis TaxID=161358 RepID=UPI003D8C7176
MNTGGPSTDDLREHYRRLIDKHGLSVVMCWTVLVPEDRTASFLLEEVGARLSGGTLHELHEAAPLSAMVPCDGDTYPVVVDRSGSAIALFEYDYLGSSLPVLQRLSQGARVYSAWWNVNFHNRLCFAAGGELILTVDAFFPGSPDHHPGLAQWPELAAMTDFFTEFKEEDEDDEDDDDYDGYDWMAAWLTVIDQTTGARLTTEWFQTEHPYVTVCMPDAAR